jgi:hypothetical protein
MSLENIVHYSTLFWLLMGAISVAVAVISHREQVKTQVFLALSARYDELLKTSSASFWFGMRCQTMLPEQSEELTITALRFCQLISVTYLLFRERQIPKRMWELLLRATEPRLRNPLFIREWEQVRHEFDTFPEFVALVTSVQDGTRK